MINKILMNKKIVNGSIILMGLSILVLMLYKFESFILPFVIAILVTFLVVPLTRFKGRKKTYVLIITIIFIIGIILSGIFIVGELFKLEPGEEIDTASIENGNTAIIDIINEDSIDIGNNNFKINDIINDEKLEELAQATIKYLINSLKQFVTLIVMVGIFLLFILPSYDSIIASHAKTLRGEKKVNFLEIMKKIEESVRQYLSVKSIISLITAIISGVIMFFFGIKYLILFILLTFFFNFIPNIGSIIAVGVVIVYELIFVGFSSQLVYLGLLLGFIQFTIGNIIEPKLFGNVMSISPIIILLALFFWGSVWGIAGMFFAVPLTVIIKIILDHTVLSMDKNNKNNN